MWLLFQRGPRTILHPSDLANPTASSARYCSTTGPLLSESDVLRKRNRMQDHAANCLSGRAEVAQREEKQPMHQLTLIENNNQSMMQTSSMMLNSEQAL